MQRFRGDSEKRVTSQGELAALQESVLTLLTSTDYQGSYLTSQHQEVTEDGGAYVHNGYEAFTCPGCHRPSLRGVRGFFKPRSCGRLTCNEALHRA